MRLNHTPEGPVLTCAGWQGLRLGPLACRASVDGRALAGADVVALSALLTTTMPAIKETIEALKAGGVRGKAQVMIGGAPVTQNYADEIGADGYSPDAASAVDTAKVLLKI